MIRASPLLTAIVTAVATAAAWFVMTVITFLAVTLITSVPREYWYREGEWQDQMLLLSAVLAALIVVIAAIGATVAVRLRSGKADPRSI